MAEKKEKPLPPGTMGWPLIGETVQFAREETGFYVEKCKQYGDIFKTNVLGSPTVCIAGTDNIRSVMEWEYDQLDIFFPKSLRLLFGPKSLLVVEGQEHAILKQQMLTGFAPSRIPQYFPSVQRHIQTHLQKWIDLGEKGRQILGYTSCVNLVAAINLEVVIGCGEKEDPDGEIKTALKDLQANSLGVPIKLPCTSFGKASNAREVIADFVKLKISQKGDQSKLSLVDLLVSLDVGKGGSLDEEKVKDNAVGVLLAGMSNITGALTCLIFLLGKQPEVLEKVREDLRCAGIEQDTALKYDDLKKLEYVECVCKELLRYLPPVGGCVRKSSRQMEFAGYRIPKDWQVIYNLRSTHDRASNQLPNGNVFDPSRWMNRDKEGSSSSSEISALDWNSCPFTPFGSGPRKCLARNFAWMIMQIFIVEIARKAKWNVINPDCPLRFRHGGYIKPADDLPCVFKMF